MLGVNWSGMIYMFHVWFGDQQWLWMIFRVVLMMLFGLMMLLRLMREVAAYNGKADYEQESNEFSFHCISTTATRESLL
jgi:hypothetical protein